MSKKLTTHLGHILSLGVLSLVIISCAGEDSNSRGNSGSITGSAA